MVDVGDVLKIMREVDIEIDPAGLAEDVPLGEQGVDSLDLSALMSQIEQEYDVIISQEQSSRLQSLRDFVSFLNSATSTR